jgi:hypothetical protein
MILPSIDICWSLAEAEAAHAGFPEIGLAHFWVGVCKAVEVSVSELLKDGNPERQAVARKPKDRLHSIHELLKSINV